MNHWMGAVSLVGILSTAVVWRTDIFFLTIGRPALRLATISAATEVMGFLHMFAGANADLGRLGNFLQHTTGRVQQDRAALVLCRIGPHAPLVRDRS
jgi:hypothetical protein